MAITNKLIIDKSTNNIKKPIYIKNTGEIFDANISNYGFDIGDLKLSHNIYAKADGWVPADGSSFSRTTYPDYFDYMVDKL